MLQFCVRFSGLKSSVDLKRPTDDVEFTPEDKLRSDAELLAFPPPRLGPGAAALCVC